MTVALSRARLGLYILGRRSLFESCFELRPAFEKLFAKPAQLELVTGEIYPAFRGVGDAGDEGGTAVMEGVEHLGQYVFEMTNAKVKAIKEGRDILPPAAEVVEEGEEEGHGVGEEDGEGEDDDDEEAGDEPEELEQA